MTGNQGFNRLAQLRDGAKKAADELTSLDLPDLPQPAATHQEVTKLLSAQVPASKKLAFDRHVLDARTYFPDLEMRAGVIALLDLLDDERIKRMWLHKISEMKG